MESLFSRQCHPNRQPWRRGRRSYFFENDTDDGGEARIEVFGNGTLDIQFIFGQFVSVGSIEGDGIVVLGTKELITGSNDLSTTFSGTIQDSDIPRHPGSLQKIGNGTLTLAGDGNTYTGATTVEGGKLIVANQSGSATGSGSVSVTRGKLGGTGIIAGATTIGTGSGTGAFLVPSSERAGLEDSCHPHHPKRTHFQRRCDYSCTFKAEQHGDTTRTKTWMVIANGVTINSEATIELIGHITGALSQGFVLTLISNTSANPMSGTFSNLPDGGIVTINGQQLPSQLLRRRWKRSHADSRALADFRLRAGRATLASDIDVLRENWLDIVASPAKTNPISSLTGRPRLIQFCYCC